MSKFNDAPMKYKTLIDLDKVTIVKQEFTLTNGEVVKLTIPKFNEENDEFLLLLIREFKDMIQAYGLFTLLNATKVFDRFCRCLSGDALDTWDSLVSGETKNETNLKKLLFNLVKTLIGDDAYN